MLVGSGLQMQHGASRQDNQYCQGAGSKGRIFTNAPSGGIRRTGFPLLRVLRVLPVRPWKGRSRIFRDRRPVSASQRQLQGTSDQPSTSRPRILWPSKRRVFIPGNWRRFFTIIGGINRTGHEMVSDMIDSLIFEDHGRPAAVMDGWRLPFDDTMDSSSRGPPVISPGNGDRPFFTLL